MPQAVSGRFNEFTLDTFSAPWKLYVKPFRFAPTMYYVGNEWVGVFLTVTEEGLILIDTGLFENVYLTLEAIREAGFDPKSIRHIMLTHCHIDHAGGAAALQQLTGARLWLSEIDADFREKPANTQMSAAGAARFQQLPYTVDSFYDDSREMHFGSTVIRTVLTPGHTPGTTSFFITAPDETGRKLTVGLHGGVGPLTMTDEYLKKYDLPADTRKRFIQDCEELKKIPVDIAVPSHPSHSLFLEKRPEDQKDYRPFIDETLWSRFLESRIGFVRNMDEKTE